MNKNRILIALLVCIIWSFLACEADVSDSASDSDTDTDKTKVTATLSYPNKFITSERNKVLEAIPKWSTEGITATYAIEPQFPVGLGLDFNTTTGTISGIPKTTLPSTLYSVTATGSGKYTGTVTSEVTIEVVATIPYSGYYFYYTSKIITGTQGEAIKSLSLQWNSAAPDDLTATFVIEPPFPVGLGLDFNTTTGTISGTPKTTLPSTSYSVTATFIRPYIGSYSTKTNSSEQINISITKPITGSFSYIDPSIVTKTNTVITTIEPTWKDKTDDAQTIRYSSTPNLPMGISINIVTGKISGKPKEVLDTTNKAYTITATGIGLYSSTKTTQIKLTIDCNNSAGTDAFCYPYIASGTDGTSSPIFAGTKPTGISYSIATTGTGTEIPTLPTINTSTGVVSVNSSTTAGSYKVSIAGAPASYSGNTVTDFYVTVKLSGSYTTLPVAVSTGQRYFGNTADYNYIQTGEITSMAYWFQAEKSFNGDISLWDVANVTDMNRMFSYANFNGDISGWDVSSVANMSEMFLRAKNFNTNIKDWDVSNVTNMSKMFEEAIAFTGVAGLNWNVSKVTDMSGMFSNATVFNGDISGWDVSNVITTGQMFYRAKAYTRDMKDWKPTSVTNMHQMFSEATAFNGDISGWDVSNVTSMESMFWKASAFDKDLDKWTVSKVKNMKFMFNEATVFNGKISSWDVSNVETMQAMFHKAESFNQDIANWNVVKVTNMLSMFDSATVFAQNIDNWNSKLNPALDKSDMFANSGLANNVPCWYDDGDNNSC